MEYFETVISAYNPLPFTIWQLQVSSYVTCKPGESRSLDPSDPHSREWWEYRDEICWQVEKRGELGVDSL
jgi:hypothetical protein